MHMYSVVLRPKHIAGGRKEYLGMGALFRCVTFSLRSFYFSPNGAPSVTSVARRLRTDLDSCFLLPFRSLAPLRSFFLTKIVLAFCLKYGGMQGRFRSKSPEDLSTLTRSFTQI
jgi:hypothetical protein